MDFEYNRAYWPERLILPWDTSKGLCLPSLVDLHIEGIHTEVKEVFLSLDIGGSFSRLESLDLSDIYYSSHGNSFGVQSSELVSEFPCLRNVQLNFGDLHADTLQTLASGAFGNNIQKLTLGYVRLSGDIPVDFRFSHFEKLNTVTIRGNFHTAIMDAFSDPDACPSLANVSLQFKGLDLGHMNLDRYVFSDRFTGLIRSWTIDNRWPRKVTDHPNEHPHNLDPWKPFITLAQRTQFRPTKIGDGRRRPWHAPDRPATPEALPWRYVCGLDSVTAVQDLEISTLEILQHGMPPNLLDKTSAAVSFKVRLIYSGLSYDQVKTVFHLVDFFHDSVDIEHCMDPSYPGVNRDRASLEAEEALWEELVESDYESSGADDSDEP